MGWYDSSRVRGSQNFQVDSKAEIKLDYKYKCDIREYFKESKGGYSFSSRRTKN